MEYYKIGEVAALFGVNPQTVRHWINGGKLECIRTPRGHRRFEKDYIDAILNGTNEAVKGTRYAILYLRTPTSTTEKEYEELERQLTTLSSWASKNGYSVQHVMKDKSSTLDGDRKGLKELEDVLNNVKEAFVIIENINIVTYFGYDYFEKWVELTGNHVVLMDSTRAPSCEVLHDLTEWLEMKT
ncbi:MerR family DNA-binding transcriptional regulator [Pontibacillus yanchengensis]|uniref:MerR family DNA-binding transcriptional regulator n=1 Tax=Pontibacillus yanchengensis TaxID=462910 RepID=UPI00137140C0|nr:MerR family DNA-binding transcriptional regulator [Pontibacillus yanchengensis]